MLHARSENVDVIQQCLPNALGISTFKLFDDPVVMVVRLGQITGVLERKMVRYRNVAVLMSSTMRAR
ncbi:MAG: hypothetical protein R2849_05545 [Thermomicrobiales bacterium]